MQRTTNSTSPSLKTIIRRGGVGKGAASTSLILEPSYLWLRLKFEWVKFESSRIYLTRDPVGPSSTMLFSSLAKHNVLQSREPGGRSAECSAQYYQHCYLNTTSHVRTRQLSRHTQAKDANLENIREKLNTTSQ